MKDFENGWSGLKSYAIATGVANADDGDDAVARKIKNILRDTLPEEDDGSGTDTDTET